MLYQSVSSCVLISVQATTIQGVDTESPFFAIRVHFTTSRFDYQVDRCEDQGHWQEIFFWMLIWHLPVWPIKGVKVISQLRSPQGSSSVFNFSSERGKWLTIVCIHWNNTSLYLALSLCVISHVIVLVVISSMYSQVMQRQV